MACSISAQLGQLEQAMEAMDQAEKIYRDLGQLGLADKVEQEKAALAKAAGR
jgi:hypothetical protein